MVFAVTLDVPSAQLVTVRHETSDGTATAGQDYARTSGTLTFAPGAKVSGRSWCGCATMR